MKKKYEKPVLTKYLSVNKLTNTVDSGYFSQHGSNVSEGANATYSVDDCYDGKDTAWAGGDYSVYCVTEGN